VEGSRILDRSDHPEEDPPSCFAKLSDLGDAMGSEDEKRAAIGLRSKTGRAIAVVVSGSWTSPRVLGRHDLVLTDEKIPATAQPYHEVMLLPWAEGERAARATETAIQEVATRALALLVEEVEARGLKVCGIGVVGSAARPLEKIGNGHIRAHAAEGILFRRVLERAAKDLGLACRALVEKGLIEIAAAELDRSVPELRRSVADLGVGVVRPWRSEEKAAATVAWLALARRR
jgi:hypothetical protein